MNLSSLTSPAAALAAVTIRRVRGAAAAGFAGEDARDVVAVEAPLTLRVEGRAVAVVMRTPGHDRELAAGFLLTEGVIRSAGEVFEISVCPSLRQAVGVAEIDQAESAEGENRSYKTYGTYLSHSADAPANDAAAAVPPGAVCDPGDSVEVLLADPGAFDPDKLTRHVFTSSSCGICSKTDLTTAILRERVIGVGAEPVISAEELAGLPELLRAEQAAFAATGGLHGCAWWEAAGRGLKAGFLFEDVGRHNALDKLLGHALLTRQLPLAQGVLVLSGRISFELVQKAHAAGIPVIAAVGAPSSLAVDYAQAAGITLCGFVRENRFNVYTHPGRIGGVA